MSVRSMTGFARVRRAVPGGELILSIKSVNHRGLDLHFHLPPELDPFETAMRALVKAEVVRGHLQIHAAFNRTVLEGASFLNRALMQAFLAAFEEARREFRVSGEPDLNAAFRIPGMLRTGAEEDVDAGMEQELTAATRDALTVLNSFREREGAAIAAEMLARAANIRELVGRMESIREGAVPAFQKRLHERLRELLRGAGVELQRLAQEAAILADRSDVSEELLRLRTHAGQVQDLLKAGGEAGKRLDFLLQEMNREANTILSKTGGLGELGLTITDLALAAKSEIDKIREQSLNLE
ncbi:MAG: YicC/YloC family endoribonuclease [Bryobacteraceae bacterium]